MKHLLRNLALLALLCVPWVTQAQNTLTVAAGSATNSQVPVHGIWADAYLRCQTIYPASMIEEAATSVFMETGSITGLTYYLSTPASAAWTGTFEVKMKETSEETLSAFADVTDATTVYTGSLDGTSSTMVIAFTTPYTYSGGNLLIEISQTAKGNYKSCTFSGVSTTSASWQGYESTELAAITGSTQGFIPKTTFSFTGGIELTCFPVTEVSVSDITSTAATINWSSANDATATYTIKNGDTEVATTAAGATSYTLTGLTAATTYSTFTVTANCGGDDHSAAVSVPSFTTACATIASFPWTVSFNDMTSNAVPVCWDNSASASSTMSSNPHYIWGVYEYSGNKMLRMNNYNVQSGTALINTPPIELPAGAYDLTFDYSHRASCGAFTVKVSTNGGSSFTELGSYTSTGSNDNSNPGEFTSALISLADYAGQTIILQFFSTSDYDQGAIFLDNVKIAAAPTCYKPTAPEATNLAVDGATISWTRDARNAAGETYTIMNGSTELGTTAAGATSFNVTGLTANTEYTLTIMTNCAAGDESVDNVLVTFTTLANCATPVLTAGGVTNITAHTADVAWTGYASNNSFVVNYRTKAYFDGVNEGFGTSIPTGWENKNGLLSSVMGGTALGSSSSPYWNFGSGNSVFDNHARLDIYGSSAKAWLITPQMTMPAGGVLTFDLALTAFSGNVGAPATTGTDDRFVVLVTTDDEATWTILREWNNSGSAYVYNDIACSATGESVNIDLSAYAGQTVRIAFYGESTTSNADNNLHIDNVAIGMNVAAGAWQDVSAATASTTLTGLESETQYEVKVKGLCDDDVESDESAVVSFTTLAGCMVPTALAVAPEGITTTTAVVSWTNGYSTDDAWEINYRVSGGAEWTVVNATANPHTLTSLEANTAYEVRMRTNCGVEGYSDWTATVSFRTACGVVSTYPWTDNLDSYSGTVSGTTNNLPSCWSYINTSTYSSYKGYPIIYNSSSSSRSGNNHLRLYSYWGVL